MAKSHILALPKQELAALLRAAQTPAYATLFQQLPAFRNALGQMVAGGTPPDTPTRNTCPCCGGARFVRIQSKACNLNWLDIPHLGFEAERCYMPSGTGIPGSGDGPSLAVCLDCGRVQGGEYPLGDKELGRRIKLYKKGVL
jgi:hypothetical protein